MQYLLAMQCLFNSLLILLLVLWLPACATSPQRAQLQTIEIPSNWATLPSEETSYGESPNALWLTYVQENPQLKGLIDKAISSNKDLAIASARVALAHAELKGIQPKRLPQIQASFAGTRQKLNAFGPSLINAPAYDNYSASLGLRWEIDLWGSLKNQIENQRARLESSQANLRFAQMSIASQVVKTWLGIMHLEGQYRLLNKQKTLQSLLTQSIEERYQKGLLPAEVLLGERVKEQILNDSLQGIALEREQVQRSLKILVGDYPEAFTIEYSPLPQLASPIPEGIPSELLLNRPDLIAIERLLAGSQAQLKSSKKQGFPNFSLTGSSGFASNELNTLLKSNNAIWSLGFSLAQPLIQYGQIRANIRASESVLKEAEANYEKVVLNAFKEVESALANEAYYQRILISTQLSLSQKEHIAAIQKAKYRTGSDNFSTYLEAELHALKGASQYLQLQFDQFQNRVSLYTALGYSFVD